MASKEHCALEDEDEIFGTRDDDSRVRISVVNEIQKPYFKESVDLPFVAEQKLIRYLEEAQKKNQAFRFSVTYSDTKGYSINTLNGVTGILGPDRTWWAILSAGREITKGVSSYMPYNGDDITIKFTQEMKEPETEEFEKAEDIRVRLSVINEIQKPHFNESVFLPFVAGQKLKRYLEKAAEYQNAFRFADNLGYSIDTINGVTGVWAILSGERLIDSGVSSYEPKSGEHITFKFTRG